MRVMSQSMTRRAALKHITAAGAGMALSGGIIRGQDGGILIGGKPVEIAVSSLSPATVRITLLPIEAGAPTPVPVDGGLAQPEAAKRVGAAGASTKFKPVRAGDLAVRFTAQPPTLHIETTAGVPVQRLMFDAQAPDMTFLLPKGPLLGLGQGGPQFDRKGQTDRMRNGQGGYQLQTHGARAPIQWLVGTDGWGMFIHHPHGAFDFTGAEGKFTPTRRLAPRSTSSSWRHAIRLVIMREYARITGLPEMPAQWTLGYMQSHRTLSGPDEILSVPKTFREKKLPCDALIYLGTEFTPSGWNTRNGEFRWKKENFPEPKTDGGRDARRALQGGPPHRHRGASHVGTRRPTRVHRPTPCRAGAMPRTSWPEDRNVACYWPYHKPLYDLGIDGWWPDQGDGLDVPSRLVRHRMYWEGTQQ